MTGPSSASAPSGVRTALDQTVSRLKASVQRRSWYEVGFLALCAAAGLLVLDLAFALPVPLRWMGLAAFVGLIALSVRRAFGAPKDAELSDDSAARLVEAGHPEFDNALIHAVQFGRTIGKASERQASLMALEIERGERTAMAVPLPNAVDRRPELKSLRLLLTALAVWVLAFVAFSDPVRTVLPRIFAPWMDDLTPPYSPTKIELSPAGTTVKYGDSLAVNVAVSGPVPEKLVIAVRTAKSDWRELPLEVVEAGKYVATLDALREDTWFEARGGGTRSARYLAKVSTPPVIQELRADYRYPDYTKIKAQQERVGEQGLHGIRDTRVAVSVTSNRALRGGQLVVEYADGQTVRSPLVPATADPRKAVCELAIKGDGTFRVSLESEDGQRNDSAAKGKVVLEHDQRPSVWFNHPAQELVVTPDMKVPLDVEAEDDIGVSQVDIHRTVNDLGDGPANIFRGAPLKRVAGQLVMDMGDLGVRPGDEIVYYAEVFDNDPGRPNFGETEPYRIKVVSDEEYKAALKQQRDAEQLRNEVRDVQDAIGSLAQRQQDLADQMDRLQKRLQANPGDAAAQKQFQEALAKQRGLQSEAEQLAQRLNDYAKSPSASEIESAVKAKVAEAAQKVGHAAQGAMKPSPSNTPAQAARQADQAAKALSQAQTPAQQASSAVQDVEKAAPLFADVERFKSLLDRQGQLVLQSKQFEDKSPTDPASQAKMRQLSEEQARVKEELKELQEDFRRDAEAARADFPKAADSAVKIADDIGKRGIPDIMGSSQDRLAKNDGPGGYQAAQRALKEMEAMMGQCGSCQSQSKGELDIKLSNSLGRSGLGQSLADCLGTGTGFGPGSGSGSATGQGSPSAMPGAGSGTAAQRSAQAYVMNTKGLSGGVRRKDMKAGRRPPTDPSNLAPEDVEVSPEANAKPPGAADASDKAYPAEYRDLIKRYFVSLTRIKK